MSAHLNVVAAGQAALGADLDLMSTDLSAAAADLDSLNAAATLASLCSTWKQHRAVIRRAIDFLQHGKVHVLFIHISLPGFLRAVGGVLEAIDGFLGRSCP